MTHPNDTRIGPNPSGLCLCGCGQQTNLASDNDPRYGSIKGQPQKYISQHHARSTSPAYTVEDRGYTTPCWIWQRRINHKGYGQTTKNGKEKPAHIVYYEQKFGTVPAGLQIDHRCRVRPCVNPDHLEPVTPLENTLRGNNTRLTWDDVRQIRQLKGIMSQSKIGELFGITQAHASRILLGKAWKEPKA